MIKFKEISRGSNTAKAIFYILANRERNRKRLNLTRLRTEVRQLLNSDLSKKDFMDTIKGLETAGAGKIVYGTRGAAKYFEWQMSVIEVGKSGEIKKEDINMQSAPRIINGERIEPIRKNGQTVFVLPNGSVKQVVFSDEISEANLKNVAKLLFDAFWNHEEPNEIGQK